MWGPNQCLRKLTPVHAIVYDVMYPMGARNHSERHQHHIDFHPLPFILILTNTRAVCVEVLQREGMESPVCGTHYRVCWERGWPEKDDAPFEKYVGVKKQVDTVLEYDGAKAMLHRLDAAHTAGASPLQALGHLEAGLRMSMDRLQLLSPFSEVRCIGGCVCVCACVNVCVL